MTFKEKQQTKEDSSIEKFLAKISIRKYSVKVSVDSGASINILNKTSFDKMRNPLSKPFHLEKNRVNIIASINQR